MRVFFILTEIKFSLINICFKLQSTGYLFLGGGICGVLGVIIFAIWGNKDKWMPDHANNFFGKFRLANSCYIVN